MGYFLRQDGTIKSKHVYEHDDEWDSYVSIGFTNYDKFGKPLPDTTETVDVID